MLISILGIVFPGFSNIGPNPREAVAHIRRQLGYSATAHDHTEESQLGSMQTEWNTVKQ